MLSKKHEHFRFSNYCLVFFFPLLFSFLGCRGYDSDYIPYRLKGLDVWVHDNAHDKNYYGGRVKANYFSRDDALSACRRRAYAVAEQYHLSDWSYVCCTVTSSSDCVTQVR
jgi:hypothetical protein